MDAIDFRKVVGSFATGVTIITTFDDQMKPWGLTANSFTSVSLSPPVISVCIAKEGRIFQILTKSKRFAVNILSADQKDLALHFASKVENRFSGIDWKMGQHNTPLLPGASGYLECVVKTRVDAGDHEILLGEVACFDHAPMQPLVYCRGHFFPATQSELTP